MAESGLIQMGISGLDVILRGGIPEGNVILLEGAAGTGKTLFGIEFIYRGAVNYDEPGIIVTFEVAPHKLIRDAAKLWLGPGNVAAAESGEDCLYQSTGDQSGAALTG